MTTKMETNLNRYLYVFLDEAGNFDFSPNGSKIFLLTSITINRPFPWDINLIALKYDLIERGFDTVYFHAAEDLQEVRDKVFAIITNNLTGVRLDSLIVEKRKTAPSLQRMENFYPRMLGYLLQYVLHPENLRNCAGVIVITDSIPFKKKRKAIAKTVKQTLSSMLPAGTNYKVLHHESKSCTGLQIADYCNWAVFRKWEREDRRSYKLIQASIQSEFDIFRRGSRIYY